MNLLKNFMWLIIKQKITSDDEIKGNDEKKPQWIYYTHVGGFWDQHMETIFYG